VLAKETSRNFLFIFLMIAEVPWNVFIPGVFFINNSQKNSHSSPDYTPCDHRAWWLTDRHVRLLTAHLLGLRRYQVPWL